VYQQSLQNVVPSSQMNAPHAAGFIQMREASLGQFAAQLLEPLVAFPSHTPPILIRPLLLFRLPLTLPVPPAAFRFGYVASRLLPVQLCQHRAAVITLIGYYLLYPLFIGCARRVLRRFQNLLDRSGISLIGRER
jgi:hypothetical protein